METVPVSVPTWLAFAASLAAAGCGAADSSGLFGPAEPASIRVEVPGISPSAAGGGTSGFGATAAPEPSSGSAREGAPSVSGGVMLRGSSASGSEVDAAAAPSAPMTPDGGVERQAPVADAGIGEAPAIEEEAPECGGALLDGSCWYLGGRDQACNDVCSTRGGVAAASAAVLGTPAQGGSIDGCTAVLAALGVLPGPVAEGYREDGVGFGCHLFVAASGAPSAWWLTAPDFSPEASAANTRVACGCVR